MRIKSVSASADRAGKYRIVFEDGDVLRLYRQTVEDFGLYSGLEMTEETYQDLLKSAGKTSAKMRAVRIVSASAVSKNDLHRRLIQKGENPEDAAAAVAWMSELSLLDDEKTAQQIVQRCIAKGYGLTRAKQALYEKRIPKDIWDSVLSDYPEQIDKITEYLESRLTGQSGRKEINKAIEALMRRGHSYGQIRKALSQLNFETDIEDTYG